LFHIHLKKLLFHSHHGIFKEEQIIGNQFEVNIRVSYTPVSLPILHLKDTINYAKIFELVEKRMAMPTPLLETVASEIAIEILAQFSLAETVFISIDKLHPPIKKIQGSVGVSLELKRE
jgi:7,8-dihydroneopterin aldolase/epimerase/oxygenase